jgi:stage IV sporulation protein A
MAGIFLSRYVSLGGNAMERFDIYSDITKRTGGALFLGVVGPVRTGKSTFIAQLMDLLVLPNVQEGPEKTRMLDELPQSGSGKTIMTTQPKFVPSEKVNIRINDKTSIDVRMVDCVGYLVPGALGAVEEELPRMVKTPWFEKDIPFEQAAEIGTKKVIEDHSTIGILVTTDGSIADIPRVSYVSAEERVASELSAIDKPYVIVLNSARPSSSDTTALGASLEEKYGAPVLIMDVKNMTKGDVSNLLEKVLYEFPLSQVNFTVPSWISALDEKHWLVEKLISEVREVSQDMGRVKDYIAVDSMMEGEEMLSAPVLSEIDLATGVIDFNIDIGRELFYSVLGEECGADIEGDMHLMNLMKDLMYAKREYDRVADALESVRRTGYGLVAPTQEELTLDEPELVKQGNKFGVRLKASGPSLHMIKVDIESVITPTIGAEQESNQLIAYMLEKFENEPAKLWETEMFGKSLNDLLKEGLATKLMGMPEDARMKIQGTLQRIINNGNGSLICILL